MCLKRDNFKWVSKDKNPTSKMKMDKYLTKIGSLETTINQICR